MNYKVGDQIMVLLDQANNSETTCGDLGIITELQPIKYLTIEHVRAKVNNEEWVFDYSSIALSHNKSMYEKRLEKLEKINALAKQLIASYPYEDRRAYDLSRIKGTILSLLIEAEKELNDVNSSAV